VPEPTLPGGTRNPANDVGAGASEVDEATRRLLQYGVVPLWIGAGLADWVCHRRTHIESTSGVQESAIHALMMAETSVPSMLGLLFEVDANVLAVTLAAFVLHQATAIWDVAYANDRREITPTEQHIHGLLEQAPAMAVMALLALHWDQARKLVSGQRPKQRLRLKRRPLSLAYVLGMCTSITAFVAVPYGEELVRCLREHRVQR
jgi:hypothetical protein